MPKDVFILGAGFSKSISSEMPTLRELGSLVNTDERLGWSWLPQQLLRAFTGNTLVSAVTPHVDVERLVTYLAQEQPFLRPEDNLSNRAQFLRVASGLSQALQEVEAAASASDPPQWLLALISRWEEDKATVATFNYDTLVEQAFRFSLPTEGDDPRRYWSHRSIYGAPVLPGDARRGFTWGQGGGEAFDYLKLHGSLNWYYSGAQSFYGEPVYDRPVPVWGKPWGSNDTDSWVKRYLPDKVPLIIPPTSDKSQWFNNELVRGQWLILGNAMRSAERIVCIGYSLPETDSLIGSLLATACLDREVLIVNSDTDLIEHYRNVLPQARLSNGYVGQAAVCEFVQAYTSTPETT